MITLNTSSTALDTGADAKVTIKKKNPLFAIIKPENKQSFSYPFALPSTRRNNTALNVILEETDFEALPTVLQKNGLPIEKGDLRITERTDKGFEVALQINQKEELFNRKFSDLRDELGVVHLTDSTPFVELYLFHILPISLSGGNLGVGSISVTVSGVVFVTTGIINQLFSNLVAAINAQTGTVNAVASSSDWRALRIEAANPALPFFAYADNSKTTFNSVSPSEEYNLPIGIAPYQSNNNQNIIDAAAHANTIDALVDFRDSEYCFPFFMTLYKDILYFCNAYDATNNQYDDASNIFYFPQFRVTAILKKVLALAGWTLNSPFLEEIDLEKLYLAHSNTVFHNTFVQFNQFFISDCLPDLSFVELCAELQKVFALVIDFDHRNKVLHVRTAAQILAQKIPTSYACTEKYRSKSLEKKGFVLQYEIPEDDERLQQVDMSLVSTAKRVGNGGVEITSAFHFLPYNKNPLLASNPNTKGLKVNPYGLGCPKSFEELGYEKAYEIYLGDAIVIQKNNLKSFNFINYTSRQATYFTENYSLEWVYSWNGLYTKCWKNYLKLLESSEVEREIILKLSELYDLDLSKKIRLEYSDYFIQELEYTLTNNEQMRILAKAKLSKFI